MTEARAYRAALDRAAVARAAGDDEAMVAPYQAAALLAHQADAVLLAFACTLEAGYARDRAAGLRQPLGKPEQLDWPDDGSMGGPHPFAAAFDTEPEAIDPDDNLFA